MAGFDVRGLPMIGLVVRHQLGEIGEAFEMLGFLRLFAIDDAGRSRRVQQHARFVAGQFVGIVGAAARNDNVLDLRVFRMSRRQRERTESESAEHGDRRYFHAR